MPVFMLQHADSIFLSGKRPTFGASVASAAGVVFRECWHSSPEPCLLWILWY